ncbi:MAG: hypothetical protein EAZ78_01785 [Oscillatoriales cyanobacterium]|nr:MAG: hypothetical protein EAZ78_01785 [Oscillatoriales cyanobacterium]TAF48047.1 MAG: hypothetical protein EAZ68_00385 [Oscillatoriales cyanobacterium]TAF66563.1 MAG: hypothetical protein EAZ59_13955 [Oscillatoriales cyanobacterium]
MQQKYKNMKNNSQSDRQKFIRHAIATAFLTQAAIIGIKGNLDVQSGKPILDVIQGMIFQGIELIVKTHRTQKSIKESDR